MIRNIDNNKELKMRAQVHTFSHYMKFFDQITMEEFRSAHQKMFQSVPYVDMQAKKRH